MQTYESDLYLAARYLRDHPPPAEAAVVIAAAYAADSAQVIFGLQAARDYAVRWTTDFVWPASGREVWYFFSQETLPSPEVRAWLGAAPAHIETNNAGAPVLEVYQLAAPPTRPTTSQPLARYAQAADLLDVIYPADFLRGQPAEVLLLWRVRPDFAVDFNDPPYIRLRLQQPGIVWAEAGGLLAYPRGHLEPDDVWAQRITLAVPAELPPQALRPELVLHTRDRAWPALASGEAGVRASLLLPPVAIVGQPIAAIGPDSQPWGSGLILSETSLPATAAPGESIYVRTTWQAASPLLADYALDVRLLSAGSLLAAAAPAQLGGVHPTSAWLPGERVTSSDPVRVPVNAPPGEHTVQIRLQDSTGTPVGGGDWHTVGTVSVSGRARHFEPPDVEAAVEAQFGGVARLIGYRLNVMSASDGRAVRLTLVWQALQSTDASLKVFVHLRRPDDPATVLAQHDSVPANGGAPTLGWLPGEFIEDEHLLTLDPGLPPGEYQLAVGLYDEGSQERLPVDASQAVSNALIVAQVNVP
jgi:hypothetical protein